MPAPTTRVLTVLELLQNQSCISGAELAERLQVDRRTVRRYITMLEELGVPVTTQQGRYGGYMLVPGYKLPPMMFTEEETLAVSLGLLAARHLGLAEVTPAVDTAQAKLERVMPENLRRRARGVADTTKLILPRPGPMLDGPVLLTLTKAIHAEQRVAFSYQAPASRATDREVDPYGLVFRQGHWYLGGFCHLRHALRSFRLDRIHHARTLPHRFCRPANFDAAEHFVRSLSGMCQNHKVTVLLHTDLETALKALDLVCTSADLREDQAQGLVLTTYTDSLEWFAKWLAYLPFDFTVQAPAELRKAVAAYARRLLDAAGADASGAR